MRFSIIVSMLAMSVSGCSCHTIDPGERGVKVTWGELQEPSLAPGFVVLGPGSSVQDVSIRSSKQEFQSDCFSSDLQQVKIKVAIITRIPETQVIKVFKEYSGNPFDVLVAPRAQEALKEVTAIRSAEQIVKQREQVKTEALLAIRKKVGEVLEVEDIIIEDISLSKELATAIEQKMVQEQEAAKAKFTKMKAEIDADTAIARAKGEADSALLKARAEAESIKIRGDALSKNPAVVELQLIERWNGVSPQVVTSGNGVNILLPAVK